MIYPKEISTRFTWLALLVSLLVILMLPMGTREVRAQTDIVKFSCDSGVDVVLEGGIELDQEAFCEDSSQWAREASVMVYITAKAVPASRDDWWTMLTDIRYREWQVGDRLNAYSVIFYVANNANASYAPITYDLSSGDFPALEFMDDDAGLKREAKMKRDVQLLLSNGEVNKGMQHLFAETYSLANPPEPTATPTATNTPVPTATPTLSAEQIRSTEVAVQVAATAEAVATAEAIVIAEKAEAARVARNAVIWFWAKIVLIFVVSIGLIVATLYFVVFPLEAFLRWRLEMLDHIDLIRGRLNGPISAMDKLLTGETVDDYNLYQVAMVAGLGTTSYHIEVRDQLLKAALLMEGVMRSWKVLTTDSPSLLGMLLGLRIWTLITTVFNNVVHARANLNKLVEYWEVVALTVLGKDFFDKTEDELEAMLEPFHKLTKADFAQQPELYLELEAYAEGFNQDTDDRPIQLVSSVEKNELSIMEIIWNTKVIMMRVTEARETVPTRISSLEHRLSESLRLDAPSGVEMSYLLLYPNSLLGDVRTSVEAQNWLRALEQIELVEEWLDELVTQKGPLDWLVHIHDELEIEMRRVEIPDVLGDATNVYKPILDLLALSAGLISNGDLSDSLDSTRQAQAGIDRILTLMPGTRYFLEDDAQVVTELEILVAEGFDLDITDDDRRGVEDQLAALRLAVDEGRYDDADAALAKAQKFSDNGLAEANALANDWQTNNDSIEELTSRVVVAEALLVDARAAMVELGNYPPQNSAEVKMFVPNYSLFLSKVGEAEDGDAELLNDVKAMNAAKTRKSVDEAKFELDHAFARVAEARVDLKKVTSRLALVKKVESEWVQTIEVLFRAVEKASRRILADERHIDDELEAAAKLIFDERIPNLRLTARQKMFVEFSREAEQILTIAQNIYTTADQEAQRMAELLHELDRARAETLSALSEANRAYDNTLEVVKTRRLNEMVEVMHDALEQLQNLVLELPRYEDQELAQFVQDRIEDWSNIAEMVENVKARVRLDQSNYNNRLNQVQSHHDNAAEAIKRADRKNDDSDAHGAGDSALSRASRAQPNSYPRSGLSFSEMEEIERLCKTAKAAADEAYNDAARRIRAEEAERERQRQLEIRRQQEAARKEAARQRKIQEKAQRDAREARQRRRDAQRQVAARRDSQRSITRR